MTGTAATQFKDHQSLASGSEITIRDHFHGEKGRGVLGLQDEVITDGRKLGVREFLSDKFQPNLSPKEKLGKLVNLNNNLTSSDLKKKDGFAVSASLKKQVEKLQADWVKDHKKLVSVPIAKPQTAAGQVPTLASKEAPVFASSAKTHPLASKLGFGDLKLTEATSQEGRIYFHHQQSTGTEAHTNNAQLDHKLKTLSRELKADLHVTSAKREAKSQKKIEGAAKGSQHLRDKAADLYATRTVNGQEVRISNQEIARAARKVGFTGFGFYEGHMHLDLREHHIKKGHTIAMWSKNVKVDHHFRKELERISPKIA